MPKPFHYSSPGTTVNNICDQSRSCRTSHWCLRGSSVWLQQLLICGKGMVKKWEKAKFGSAPDSYLCWKRGRKKHWFSTTTTWENSHCFLQSWLLSSRAVSFTRERNSPHVQAASPGVSERAERLHSQQSVVEREGNAYSALSAPHDLLELGVPCLRLWGLISWKVPRDLELPWITVPFPFCPKWHQLSAHGPGQSTQGSFCAHLCPLLEAWWRAWHPSRFLLFNTKNCIVADGDPPNSHRENGPKLLLIHQCEHINRYPNY